jgi:hypothetical protein
VRKRSFVFAIIERQDFQAIGRRLAVEKEGRSRELCGDDHWKF